MMSEDQFKTSLIFFVNGKKVVEENPNPEWTLLYYLRSKLRLFGVKLGCGEGGCGACTVMVSKYNRTTQKVVNFPVNACLAPVCSMHGLAITTIEGIGSTRTKLHPVQERIAKNHGSQCGFCTPGIVMSMYTLLRNMPKPSMQDLEVAFQGNLCRCTGYRPIIEAYKTFTEEWEVLRKSINASGINGCGMGNKCCKLDKNLNNEDDELFELSTFKPYDASQEPIFPPELKLNPELDLLGLHFKSKNVSWYRPITIESLLVLKSTIENSKVVVGNTEIGVEIKYKNKLYPTLVQTSHIPEMNILILEKKGMRVGASVTLNDLNEKLIKATKTLPDHETKVFTAIIEMLHWFAGKQIRSVASVGGNIITGSPISDLNPIFMAANIEMVLQSSSTKRTVNFNKNFFTGYRTNILSKDEVLVSILIPLTTQNQYFYSYKQARRRDDDIAIVNSAMNFIFKENSKVIQEVVLSFGGMAATTLTASKTQDRLQNFVWSEDILEVAYLTLLEDLPLSSDAPGGMIELRKSLPMSFFYKTYVNICRELRDLNFDIKIDPRDLSASRNFSYQTPKSTQFFHVTPREETYDKVGKPIVHLSAYKQASGEATYLDDIPKVDNEMSIAFVYSHKAHAKVLSIDPSNALEIEGVIGFISAKDIKSNIKHGLIIQDEDVFVSDVTTSEYQLLGAILGEDRFIAQSAAMLVDVKYEELHPVIISIEDAIKHNSFFPGSKKIEAGNVDEAFKKCKHVIEGECRTGYQEHFYLETQGCLVIPKEEDELEVFCSTQHHAYINENISKILEIPQNKVVVRVRRIGGGFGGKETRHVSLVVAASFGARKFRRPVRFQLNRDEDMAFTGGRHPFLFRYKVGFEENGKITALQVFVFSNAGYSYDMSVEVLERAMFALENVYKIPNVRYIGKCCKTNIASNTAFRGFGSPQAMFNAETVIRDVADCLGRDSIEIARVNLYEEGDITHYNFEMNDLHIEDCLDECLERSQYYKRKEAIEVFNSENRWKKRGISATVWKYGCGYGIPVCEQAGALVIVYTDGSVLLTHGGVEMGQGLHTKMIQICSKVLEVPIEKIHTSENATDKVPNTQSTAASFSSDLNGPAVMRACMTIKERLKPIVAKNPKGTWEDWVKAAYLERISLSATGFYASPPIHYDFETKTGVPYHYLTFGAVCTEVEIDCLTGDHRVLKTDIVMDLGTSLNPAIDIGQIEGGFMQGYGLFVMEEIVYSPNGTMYSKGPGAYKIPGFNDIPIEFNVSLLKGVSNTNPKAIYSSKAVGEPPLFSGSSVLFAIREAIKSAREDAGITDRFTLNAPATAEKIRMLCEDGITKKVQKDCVGTWSKVL